MTTGTAKELITSDLDRDAIQKIEGELKRLLADTFALYLKTKGFHWHVRGRHFRDYHLMLDEQAGQLFDITDEIAERARKLGARTLRSIGDISKHQRLHDTAGEITDANAMLAELHADNRKLTGFMRAAHETCERHRDVATASLLEVWIDHAERRSWFLSEILSANGAEDSK